MEGPAPGTPEYYNRYPRKAPRPRDPLPNESPWVDDVRQVYDRAAAHNLLLCSSLLLLYGDTPPAACAP